MRLTPARVLRGSLWRLGQACQKLAQRVPIPEEPIPLAQTESPPEPPSLVEVLERQGDWVTCRIDGLIWRLDPSQCIDADLLDDGLFEPASTEWVDKLVTPGMVVVDVGANIGYYTVRLSRLVGPHGQVHAFEPSKRYRDRLLDHLERNNCDNVVISDYGLSDAASEQVLYGDNISASMHWADDGKPPTISEKIPVRTLDSYVAEMKLTQLDFIKVDVDGHEPKFIVGAAKTLQQFQPIILMEFSQINLVSANSNVDTLANQLRSLGYSLHSEITGEPYLTHANFLREVMNCSHSVNLICRPHASASTTWQS
ncbi:MAG TPA: FkbM family methyltransferase [Pyrinomonadaceae bacterium]|nr:FkbM family methyltransferase [Pyrinomonadaceae bacterium]